MIFFEQQIQSTAIEIPSLEFPTARGDQKVSIPIPVRPLNVVQQLKLVIPFRPVADAQIAYGLIDAVRRARADPTGSCSR